MQNSAGSHNPQKQHRYFVGPVTDFLFMGGLSLLFFAIIRYALPAERPPWVYMLAGWLVWVGNWPHFSATNYRLYKSKENIKQYPLTATVVPIVVLAGMIASCLSPNVVAPYFVKFFLIWSPYHFSGQTIGVSLIYARRNGIVFSKLERSTFSGFVFGTYLFATIASEISPNGFEYYGITYPSFGLPMWTLHTAELLMWGSGAVFLGLLAKRMISGRSWVHPMILLPAVSQYVWFVLGRGTPAFTEFVPFFHSIQYLLVAWAMEVVEEREKRAGEVQKGFFYSASMRWGFLNVLGGAVLFYFLPRVFAFFSLPLNFALGIVNSGVQIHHFFVDGVIWKLRRQSVSHPLMENIPSLYAQTSTRPS